MTRHYKKSTKVRNIFNDSNINYFENYEDMTEKYYTSYKNKSLLEIINEIYEEDELKLNDDLKFINDDEYKFLIQSLITIDCKKIKMKKRFKFKLFNHLKKSFYEMDDLLKYLFMIEPLFNYKKCKDDYMYNGHAGALYIYSILTEKIIIFEKWMLKYLIFIFKIFKLFDVPIFEGHSIKKYWANKYNFEQRRYFIECDLCTEKNDCGTFENMGPASLYYYKNVVENDEKDVKNNQYHFINKIILKNYNNIFIDEIDNKIVKANKTKKKP